MWESQRPGLQTSYASAHLHKLDASIPRRYLLISPHCARNIDAIKCFLPYKNISTRSQYKTIVERHSSCLLSKIIKQLPYIVLTYAQIAFLSTKTPFPRSRKVHTYSKLGSTRPNVMSVSALYFQNPAMTPNKR